MSAEPASAVSELAATIRKQWGRAASPRSRDARSSRLHADGRVRQASSFRHSTAVHAACRHERDTRRCLQPSFQSRTDLVRYYELTWTGHAGTAPEVPFRRGCTILAEIRGLKHRQRQSGHRITLSHRHGTYADFRSSRQAVRRQDHGGEPFSKPEMSGFVIQSRHEGGAVRARTRAIARSPAAVYPPRRPLLAGPQSHSYKPGNPSQNTLQRPLERPDDGHRAHLFHHQA